MGDQDLETFLATNGVDDEAGDLLRACSPEIQAKVMARGGCAECRFPGGVIKKRIKDAENAATSVYSQEVEDFISLLGLDERAMEVLRASDPEIQRIVMDRGDCGDAANPSAMILARVRDAKRDKGKGKGGGSRNKGYSDYGGSGAWGYGGYSDAWGGKGMYGMDDWGGKGMYGKAMYGYGGMPPMGKGYNAKGDDGSEDYGCYNFDAFNQPAFVQARMEASQPPRKRARAEPKASHMEATDSQTANSSGGSPVIHWLVSPPESPLVQQGMPEDGPAIFFNKEQSVFQSASYILGDLVFEGAEVEHDPDWKIYPGLGDQFKQATGEENCFAIAKARGRWGAGFHAGKKGREAAAKLALAVALASGTPKEAELCGRYNDFARMLSGEGTPDAKPVFIPAPVPQGTTPLAYPISVQGTGPIAERGLALQGYAMVYDKKFVDSFSNSARMLDSLLGSEMPTEIVHDADWNKFPEVGQALAPSGIEENCYAVGFCPNLGRWAVGVGANWKAREHSVKLALAVAVAYDSPHYAITVSNYPDFGAICESAEYPGSDQSGGLA